MSLRCMHSFSEYVLSMDAFNAAPCILVDVSVPVGIALRAADSCLWPCVKRAACSAYGSHVWVGCIDKTLQS